MIYGKVLFPIIQDGAKVAKGLTLQQTTESDTMLSFPIVHMHLSSFGGFLRLDML